MCDQTPRPRWKRGRWNSIDNKRKPVPGNGRAVHLALVPDLQFRLGGGGGFNLAGKWEDEYEYAGSGDGI